MKKPQNVNVKPTRRRSRDTLGNYVRGGVETLTRGRDPRWDGGPIARKKSTSSWDKDCEKKTNHHTREGAGRRSRPVPKNKTTIVTAKLAYKDEPMRKELLAFQQGRATGGYDLEYRTKKRAKNLRAARMINNKRGEERKPPVEWRNSKGRRQEAVKRGQLEGVWEQGGDMECVREGGLGGIACRSSSKSDRSVNSWKVGGGCETDQGSQDQAAPKAGGASGVKLSLQRGTKDQSGKTEVGPNLGAKKGFVRGISQGVFEGAFRWAAYRVTDERDG